MKRNYKKELYKGLTGLFILLVCLLVPALPSAASGTYWQSRDGRISLTLPAGFATTNAPYENTCLAAISPEGRRSIVITSQELKEPLSAKKKKQYLANCWNEYAWTLQKNANVRDIVRDVSHVGTHRAARLTYVQHFKTPDGDTDLYVERQLIVTGQTVYVLTLSLDNDNLATYLSAMEDSIQSFVIF